MVPAELMFKMVLMKVSQGGKLKVESLQKKIDAALLEKG